MCWQVKFHETLALVLFIVGGTCDLLDGPESRGGRSSHHFGF